MVNAFLAGTKFVACRAWFLSAMLWFMLLATFGLWLGSVEWSDGGQPLFNGERWIESGQAIREQLTIEGEGLYGIDAAVLRKSDVGGLVVLRLTSDGEGEHELAVASAPAGWAEDVSKAVRRPYRFVPFRFPPLSVTADEQVWLWLEPGTGGLLGIRCLNSRAGTRLALKTHYRKSVTENAALFLARLTRGRPGWFSSAWFYVCLGLLYAALLAGLLRLLTGRASRCGQRARDGIQ